MKIKALQIQDFRGLSNVNITNFDEHLNLFIGVNGAGKSSLLDAIALLLSSFTARLTTSKSAGNLINTDDVQRDSKKGCSLTLTINSGNNTISWTKFKQKNLNKKEVSSYEELNAYTNPLREQIDHEELRSVPIIVHYGVKRTVTDIPLRFPNTEKSGPTATYKDWIDSKSSYHDIFPWIRTEEDYENELIRENPEARDRGLEALRQAMRIIFPEYTDMRVRRKPRQEVVLKKNKVEFPLSLLSDGEKCYIALVCDIVRRLALANPEGDILNGDGIVLIDEVDLHLHPSWEQTVMVKLHQTFKNIQFIVSAHSPLVASHFDGQVYAVDNGVVSPLPKLLGLDYSKILQDFMSTSPNNKELDSLAEMYKAYKSNKMEENATAVLDEIKRLLGNDVESPFYQSLTKED